MFESTTQLTTADLKKIADMLTNDQLFQIVAHHTLRVEMEIQKEVLSDIENNDADDILHARRVVKDPALLAKICIGINVDMESYVEDAIKTLAPQYTVK